MVARAFVLTPFTSTHRRASQSRGLTRDLAFTVVTLLGLSACQEKSPAPLEVDAGIHGGVAPSAAPSASVVGPHEDDTSPRQPSASGSIFCRAIAGKGRLPIRDLYVKTGDLAGYGYASGMADPRQDKSVECDDKEISGSAICAEGFVVAPVDQGAHLVLAFNVRQDQWTEAMGDQPIVTHAYPKVIRRLDIDYTAAGVGEQRVCVKTAAHTYCSVVVPSPPPDAKDSVGERPEELTEEEVAAPSKILVAKNHRYSLSSSQFLEVLSTGTGTAWDGSGFKTLELRLELAARSRRLYWACLKSVQVTPSGAAHR